jgi:predicted nucleic acid-binding protein
MQKPKLVAVDTNILLRLASADETAVDAWNLIKFRLKPIQFVVSPTVLGELAHQMQEAPDSMMRDAARSALRQLRAHWNFHATEFNAVQKALSTNAAQKLRASALIPYEERNDALILSEAAVLECILLVSRDSHLLEIDFQRLTLLFRQLDLVPPVIASPEILLRNFDP